MWQELDYLCTSATVPKGPFHDAANIVCNAPKLQHSCNLALGGLRPSWTTQEECLKTNNYALVKNPFKVQKGH